MLYYKKKPPLSQGGKVSFRCTFQKKIRFLIGACRFADVQPSSIKGALTLEREYRAKKRVQSAEYRVQIIYWIKKRHPELVIKINLNSALCTLNSLSNVKVPFQKPTE